MGEGVANHFRLLMDLLGHEMPVIALVHEEGRCRGAQNCAFNLAALRITDLCALAREHGGVAILKIRDGIREGSKRNGVRAEKHFAFAITYGQWRALARPDQKVFLALEQEGERKCAPQARQRSRDCVGRGVALALFLGDEMRHNLGIGLGAERGALLLQLLAELAKVLDDTVVHDGESVGGMGVSVAFRRAPVGGPTGMPDADRTFERLLDEPRLEIAQLALRAPPRKLATLQGGNTGGIITAVFKSLQRVD